MTKINPAIIRDPEARRLLAEIADTLKDMGDKLQLALNGPPPIQSGGPWDGRATPKIEACECLQENCTCNKEWAGR